MPRRKNDEASNGHARNEHPAAVFVDRLVNLEEERRELALQIREVYDEAKNAGHLKGAIRLVVKRKLETEDQRETREAIEREAEQILATLGMLKGTPLGDYAVAATPAYADA